MGLPKDQKYLGRTKIESSYFLTKLKNSLGPYGPNSTGMIDKTPTSLSPSSKRRHYSKIQPEFLEKFKRSPVGDSISIENCSQSFVKYRSIDHDHPSKTPDSKDSCHPANHLVDIKDSPSTSIDRSPTPGHRVLGDSRSLSQSGKVNFKLNYGAKNLGSHK
jgi:hypothetical protein